MSIREHSEVESGDDADLGAALAAADAALRQLDVARGREKHLGEQVERLEKRLLATEDEVAELQRELEARSELVGAIQRTRSWTWTAPFRAFRRLLTRR